MKITNKHGLPETIVNVLQRPTYSKGGANLSVTELIDSPRISQLRRKYDDQIEKDASEMVWSIFGSAIHGVLEHGKDEHHVIEERLHTTLEGWTISGAIDLQTNTKDGIIISDYKTTSAWSVMNEKSSWTEQLNLYAWLVEKVKAVPVVELEIVAIIRDWTRRDALSKTLYPPAPIATIKISLWDFEQREKFVRDRLHQHADAYMCTETQSELPLCTPDEMWEKPSSWALKKPKNVRATAVVLSEEEAKAKQEELGKEYVIEFRPGERTRCEHYCPVSQFCNQWESYQNGK
jgi:hypothetical protein